MGRHLAGQTGMIDAEQAKANSEAAAQWAEYLGMLADKRVPTVSVDDAVSGKLPKGYEGRQSQPGVVR